MASELGAGIRCVLMRGGTSKGAYFLAGDLPADAAERDELILRVMGTPDPRQIDGIGGAHPLTSKVAIVGPSDDGEADVDYLFLQVGVEEAAVSDRQNCGNLLAGVGPFAVERGLVPPGRPVRIRMLNTGERAVASFPFEDGHPRYDGDTAISGVPGTAAAIEIEFPGSADGVLLPTGNVRDVVAGVEVTCVDNGMPTVLVRAADLGVSGKESPAELEADAGLAARLRAVRLEAGRAMGLGDVSGTSIPKLTLLSPPLGGGTVGTRTFIPVRCHTAIGVLGAVSVATGLRIKGAVGAELADLRPGPTRIEHPTGFFDVRAEVGWSDGRPYPVRSGVIRTARPLFDGVVFPRPTLEGS